MRTLNRPMFNWGGPVKEGIMHGIREPRQGGGRTGFVNAGEVYKNVEEFYKPPKKQTSGIVNTKKGYQFAETPASKALTGFTHYGPYSAMAALYDVGAVPINTLSRMFGHNPGFSGTKFMDTLTKGAYSKRTGYDPDKAHFIAPTSAKKGWTIPSMQEEIQKKIDPNTVVKKTWTPGGTKTDPILTQSMLDKVAATKAQRQKNKMLEIMGYDDSKKDAAYNALIDASQIIAAAPGGKSLDISKDIIQPAIAATSKQFDKPKDIKEAVGLLMAKGEIEKDIAAGKGGTLKQNATDLVNAGVFKTQAEAMEHLAKTESIREKAVTWAASQKKPIDQITVIDVMADTYGSRPNVLRSEDDMDKVQKEDDYVSDLVVFEKIKDKDKLGPGHYVIGRAGFVINSDGSVKQVLG